MSYAGDMTNPVLLAAQAMMRSTDPACHEAWRKLASLYHVTFSIEARRDDQVGQHVLHEVAFLAESSEHAGVIAKSMLASVLSGNMYWFDECIGLPPTEEDIEISIMPLFARLITELAIQMECADMLRDCNTLEVSK